MRRYALAFALACATPLAAQTPAPPPEDGLTLMERGAQMLLRQFLDEVGPKVGEVQDALTALEPALRDLLSMIGDFRHYEKPERLPNGDIILRRKPDAPPLTAPLRPGEALDV